MNQFQQYSVEEMRVGDYSRGDKGGDQGGAGGFGASGFGGGAFGASGFGQSSSAFGATAAFGAPSQPSMFGNTASGFGAGTSLFGQTQQQQQPTGFGAFGQTQSGFGQPSSGFDQSTPGFGQPASGFGASSSGFGSSGAGTFGAGVFGGGSTGFGQTAAPSTGFGSTFGDAGSTGFGASTAGGFGSVGFGATGFGASAAAASSQSLFGGGGQQTGGLFGAPQSTPSLFGQQSASGFGATAQSTPSLFGGGAGQSSASSLFGGQPQSGGGLFGGAQASSGGLFGGGQSSSSIFGNPQSASGQFAASSGGFGGSGLFGGGFGSTPQSSSLFGGSSMGASSGGGLFGSASTGTSLFGNTGSGLFGSGSGAGFGASSSGLFGSNPGGSLFGNTASGFGMSGSMFGGGLGFGAANQQQQQLQQQQQGPLEASLTNNPFGSSNLFSNITKGTGSNATSLNPMSSSGQGKTVSVVVGSVGGRPRRVRAGEGLQPMNRGGNRFMADSWYRPRSRPWSRTGPLFDLDDIIRQDDHSHNSITPWRTEEQRAKARNLKKLIIEPIEDDQVLKSATLGPRANGRQKERPPEVPNFLEPDQEPSQALIPSAGVVVTPQQSQREQHDDGEDTVLAIDDVEPADRSVKTEESGEHEAAVNEEENTPYSARFVPYSDFYRNQLSSERRRWSYNESSDNKPVTQKSLVPMCERPEYSTIPSMDKLRQMSEEELAQVQDFTVYRDIVGEVRWEGAVDVRGLNLDEIVSIEAGTVTIYPSNDKVPVPGEELNKPAVVKMHGIWKKKGGIVQKDARSVAKMVKNLKHHCDREGLQFLGYDVTTGTWSFRATRF